MSNKSPLEIAIDSAFAPRAQMSRRQILRAGVAGGGILIMGSGLLAACSTDGTPAPAGSGNGNSPVQGGVLNIGADADPIGMDPTTSNAMASFDPIALMYNGLLRWNEKMEIEPDLAKSYENPDPTTYIFHLRTGIKFHNGNGFTAEDVKYTLDRIADPKTGSPRVDFAKAIKELTIIDASTVKIELESPDASFLPFLASIPDGAMVPKGSTDLASAPVGTGPFVFDSYQPNQQLTLKANPDYYEKDLPYLATVVFKFFKDQSSITSALRSKAIDMTWLKDPQVAELTAKTLSDVVSVPGETTRAFPVWFSTGNAALKDVNVRRALSLATDRTACLQTVLKGSAKISAAIPESKTGGWDGKGDMPYYKHDIAEAKKLLAGAGFEDGIDLGDYQVVAANALDVQCAQVLQEQWAQAGIKVNIKPMETAPLIANWTSGNFGVLSLSRIAGTWDPDPEVSRFASDSPFGSAIKMSDTTLDSMLSAARIELDTKKRAADYLKIQERIADQAHALYIYQYPLRWELYWNYVKGYHAVPTNIHSYVRTSWLDK